MMMNGYWSNEWEPIYKLFIELNTLQEQNQFDMDHLISITWNKDIQSFQVLRDWRSDACKYSAAVFSRRISDSWWQLLTPDVSMCINAYRCKHLSTIMGKRNLRWSPDTGNCEPKMFKCRPSFPYYYNYLSHDSPDIISLLSCHCFH